MTQSFAQQQHARFLAQRVERKEQQTASEFTSRVRSLLSDRHSDVLRYVPGGSPNTVRFQIASAISRGGEPRFIEVVMNFQAGKAPIEIRSKSQVSPGTSRDNIDLGGPIPALIAKHALLKEEHELAAKAVSQLKAKILASGDLSAFGDPKNATRIERNPHVVSHQMRTRVETERADGRPFSFEVIAAFETTKGRTTLLNLEARGGTLLPNRTRVLAGSLTPHLPVSTLIADEKVQKRLADGFKKG